jgi:regulator of cell morphogenesis and NO signaling
MNLNSSYTNRTISEIVRTDYRTADIFKKYGINYCCGGNLSMQEACTQKDLNLEAISYELQQATRNVQLFNHLDFDNWKIDFLADYIVNVHHAYLYKTLPGLEVSMISFVNSHSKQHPEFLQIQDLFLELSGLVLKHIKEEEDVIFPYIKQIDNTYRRKETYGSLFVKTLRKPMAAMDVEHHRIKELLQELRAAAGNYEIPEKACTNHQVIFKKLQEFDNDLVQHKHLENNILFLKAEAMEKELLLQN